MHKKGVSKVIVVLILIFLSIIGVTIVWFSVDKTVEASVHDIAISRFSKDLEIVKNSVTYDSNEGILNLSIVKKTNVANLIGVKFSIKNFTNEFIHEEKISIGMGKQNSTLLI